MGMNRLKWDERFMRLAQEISTWSKDPSTRVGTVIVDHDNRVVATGYNGFPRGIDDDVRRYEDKETKYKLIVHGESNAILNAVGSLRHATLYSTKFPCSECTKLIVQCGISRIVAPPPSTTGKWAEDAVYSDLMLKEACVFVHFHMPGARASI